MTAVASLIAQKDAVEIRRDRRLVIAAALVALLAVAALFATHARLTSYQRDRAAAAAMESASWLGQGARDPHSAAHFSQWAFRPLNAPALLDPGTLPQVGSAIWLEAHARNPAAVRAVEDRADTLDLGEFSVAWVLQTLAPLLLLVIAAGAVARERERGTLRLLLASGVQPDRVIAAKVYAAGRIAALIVAPLLLVAVLAVVLAPGRAGVDEIARTLLWCGSHALWLSVAILIGVAVSARSRSVAAAMAVAIGLWVVAVPLAPRAAASLAETLHPTPSGERFWADVQHRIRDGIGGSGDADQRSAALRTELLRRYRVRDVEALPISWRGANLDASERFGNRVFDRAWAELRGIEDAQRTTMRWASVLTPLIALQNVSTALAGTDNRHARAFADQAEAERQRLVNGLNRDLALQGGGKSTYRADARLWGSFGSFVPTPVGLGEALRAVWPDLIILVAWLAATVWFVRRAGAKLGRESVG